MWSSLVTTVLIAFNVATTTSSPQRLRRSVKSKKMMMCMDAELNIAMNGLDCSSVTDCSLPGLPSHCPLTCDNCEIYGCSDSNLSFLYDGDALSCSGFEGLDPDTIAFYCSLPGVTSTCRGTCGFCDMMTMEPTMSPMMEMTMEPTMMPTMEMTIEPTMMPTMDMTMEPTMMPTMEMTMEPTMMPTMEMTMDPTMMPTMEMSMDPTIMPTMEMTMEPTMMPTMEMSMDPTMMPTMEMTMEPTMMPTMEMTMDPTMMPTMKMTMELTMMPTMEMSMDPTMMPTMEVTMEPTMMPTMEMSMDPTMMPTMEMTMEPTMMPTMEMSMEPTMMPTMEMSMEPTMMPTMKMTMEPTMMPTMEMTMDPTMMPTMKMTMEPTMMPTIEMSMEPSMKPTMMMSMGPTMSPTMMMTMDPISCMDSELNISLNNLGCPFLIDNMEYCDLPGAGSHCPLTCDECEEFACADSEVSFLFDGDTFLCSDFDLLDPETVMLYCSFPGVTSTCRESCGACGMMTMEPTMSPMTPSPTTTPAPTNMMTLCMDSELNIALNGLGCPFLSLNPEHMEYCDLPGAGSHCPLTCGDCEEYACADSEVAFVAGGDAYTCAAFDLLDPEDVDYYCGLPGVASTCRSTCGYCM